MSSLAGALDPPVPAPKESPKEEDVPMELPDTVLDAESESKDEEMHDLFGEAEDDNVNIVKHDEATTPASSEPAEPLDGLTSPERRHRQDMEYAEAEQDEGEPVINQVLEADAPIPNIPVPRSSDGNYWVIRMPNFVKVDSKPFHPDTYIGPEQEDEDAQHAETVREKSMTIKLKVENTVRWRWVKDGNGEDRRQSNGRIVRWSDGTLSLQLGKELFDITQQVDTSGAMPRQAFGGSQQGSQSQPTASQPTAPGRSQGLTYLVAQHKRAEILQCEALVTGYMSLRPTGMQSETHRMLVRAVGQKHNKVARLRMAPDPTTDPEREKLEMMKQAARKPRKVRGEDDVLGARRRRASYTRKRTGDDMWSDDEEDAVFGGGSEDEYGDEGAAGGRGAKRRKSGQEEDGKKGPGEYQTDDFLVADSDEDGAFGDSDDDGGKPKRSRRSKAEDEDAEEDDLEKLESQIQRREAEERKRRKDSGKRGAEASSDQEAPDDGEGEGQMEVESEEDDGFGVRRQSAPSRRRKVVGPDEEDEE
ncbi:uncharacterized protein FIBRA_07620 [Fibroporia radiculosa]|uniref:Leo1-like protein n=1 Tax=Fibroporia radiculosa TaxID=599839 RepID=J4H4Q6_9APHY|nr:uncharacterized protein FIBRA_07620 [Fibroporia radiculosa]CCM05404.1 predicted protein [Fibroporia radiculosa]